MTKYLRGLIYFSGLFLLVLPVHAQWQTVHPSSPLNRYFASIIHPPNSTLWYAVGYDLAVSSDEGNTWYRSETFSLPSPLLSPMSDYWDVCFTSSTTAYLVNQNRIYKTVDTGETWTISLEINPSHAKYKSSAYFRSIMFVNPQTGFAVGDFNKVFKTSDGGTTWSVVSWNASTAPYRSLTDVYFIDEQTGYVSGYEVDDIAMNFGFTEFVMKTRDGGLTWEQLNIPTSWSHRKIRIQFVNEQVGFAHLAVSQELDETWRTEDGGETWVKNSPADVRYIHKAYWASDQVGFLYGADHFYRIKFYTTTDGGGQWSETALPVFDNQDEKIVTDISFRNESTGCIVGAGGNILVTRDKGSVWESRNQGYPYFSKFSFLNDQVGYATTGNGLFKTNDAGRSWQFVEGSAFYAVSDMYLRDENNGFLLGYRGRFYQLTDGVITELSLPVKHVYLAYLLQHGDSLLVCGSDVKSSGNFLIKSGDGGKTWKHLAIPHPGTIVGIDHVHDVLYVAMTEGILRSEDNGLTWEKIVTIQGDYLQRLAFVSSTRAVAYFSVAGVCTSENGGVTWTPVEHDFDDANVHTFFVLNDQTVYAGGSHYEGQGQYAKIWRSDNAGINWAEDEVGNAIPFGVNDIKIVGNEILATAGYGQIFSNTLSGKYFQSILFAPLPMKVYGNPDFALTATATSSLPVTFTSSDPNVAIVVDAMVTITGPGETIITAHQPGNETYLAARSVGHKLVVAATTGSEKPGAEVVNVYPNPAGDYVFLEPGLPDPDVELIVYDNSGKRVGASLAPISLVGGVFRLDIRHLPAGQYYVVTRSNRKKIVMRFIKK